MWLGEQISERGIGNGISLVIFSGIIANIPQGFSSAWEHRDKFFGLGIFGFLILLGFIFLLIATVIFFERCQRRIPIQYAKRVVGNKMYAGQTSHLPLKINMAGVIPPIFASSILLFLPMLGQLGGSEQIQKWVGFFSSGIVYYSLYVIAIIFFTFFYTAVTFNPVDVAENLQKHGGFVPGIRPGKSTSDYLDRILTRITTGGALYIAGICILPQLLIQFFGVDTTLAATFGGTSILIVVGVAMDTVAQVESHLLSRSYEGFLGAKGGRFKGRRG
jgi:preprotein translocase subunit SecY